jgi:hypothetical protein
MHKDEETIEPGDSFEAIQRMHGGTDPRKCQDPFSQKNHNPRMARRKRVDAIARTEREKRQAEENLAAEIIQNSTSITYEGHEFVTRNFAVEDWNKSTQRRFARWVQNWSGLTRPWQCVIDQGINEEFKEIKGKELVVLHPEEDWRNGQVVLKCKPKKNCPWRGVRDRPVRIKIGERTGCIHNGDEKSGFEGRIVRSLKKSDARKGVS